MPLCPHCHSHTPLGASQLGEPCPECGEKSADDSGYRDIARIGNLAEAGYLVSRLDAEGMEADLAVRESFDAVTGAWNQTYVLQVPAQDLAAAKEVLLDEAAEANYEEAEFARRGEPLDDEPVHLVFWRPVALMAVAGLATLWLSGRVLEQRQRAAPQRGNQALGSAVDAIGQPFTVQTQTGRVVHRLRYSKANRTWLLESDTDGDGQLDRISRFADVPEAARD